MLYDFTLKIQFSMIKNNSTKDHNTISIKENVLNDENLDIYNKILKSKHFRNIKKLFLLISIYNDKSRSMNQN